MVKLETERNVRKAPKKAEVSAEIPEAAFFEEGNLELGDPYRLTADTTLMEESIQELGTGGSSLMAVYLREINHPLLTQKEEVELAKRIEKGRFATEALAGMPLVDPLEDEDRQLKRKEIETEIRFNQDTILEIDSESLDPSLKMAEKRRLEEKIVKDQ